ncbi:hypothetical protein D9758_016182 [Tetrapyrgos nigripes]|uniref:Prenyltransferase alpha-alpha toroid domain-containing protein n=1 Tax=Tetrapyrgos nigripes TaxID=182062 RepID=A0A8H5C5C7_9AGAR|nr:hypothetical protein D9758_016182 [Tetrapyrgos nigripes]
MFSLVFAAGPYGAGFRPSPFMNTNSSATYTVILTLAILHDDFTRLDREGLGRLVGSCQRVEERGDGSFSTIPLSSSTSASAPSQSGTEGTKASASTATTGARTGPGSGEDGETVSMATATAASRRDGGTGADDVGTDEGRDTDLRTLYCAFVLCHLLDDWSTVDVKKAMEFVGGCLGRRLGRILTPTTYTSL